MNSKVYFFVGLALLITGVVFKIMDYPRMVLMPFFIGGGGFKAVFLIKGFRSGQLAGRLNLSLFLFGLLLLFLSITVRNTLGLTLQANVLLFTALIIKVVSIVAMKRTARLRMESQDPGVFNNHQDIS